jgi:hypothetical protein
MVLRILTPQYAAAMPPQDRGRCSTLRAGAVDPESDREWDPKGDRGRLSGLSFPSDGTTVDATRGREMLVGVPFDSIMRVALALGTVAYLVWLFPRLTKDLPGRVWRIGIALFLLWSLYQALFTDEAADCEARGGTWIGEGSGQGADHYCSSSS